MKKIISLLLVLAMALALAACGEKAPEAQTPAADGYQVRVVDALGNPYTSGVIVRFLQNGQQVAMQVVNENGVAVKELEDGAYTVELQHTDADAKYYYDQNGLTLDANNKSLEIVLSQMPAAVVEGLFAYSLLTDGNKDHTAAVVNTGCTYVELVSGERNYFLFTPTEAGTYEIRVVGSETVLGYYGSPNFVQQFSAVDVVDNTVTLSVSAGNIGDGGASSYVLGLDAVNAETSAILSIQRTGAPVQSIEDEPWLVYTAKTAPSPYTLTLEEGQQLKRVDIKADASAYELVLGADGYYHLGTADGPVMLVQLCAGAAGNPPYICFMDMVGDGTPDKGVTALRKYFFDENGEFMKKEDYTDCMISYNVCADKTYGVYPLTEDLVYMIRNGGQQQGWYDAEGHGYLFLDTNGNHVMGVNAEISWMFACCYVE